MNPSEAVKTTKGIIDLNYALISGKPEEERDWKTWRSLHAPGARLIPIEGESRIARVMSPDEWIASRTPLLRKMSFYEYETDREELQYGRLAQVWSRYIATSEPGGEPIRRGANSIQLWNDGTRWWILSVAWDAVEALNV
ncbi:MAG TPA: hypothetical protein VF042_05100 [Gemmatimonadaceae bacterium]